jgi:LEA14-like dessication related protein
MQSSSAPGAVQFYVADVPSKVPLRHRKWPYIVCTVLIGALLLIAIIVVLIVLLIYFLYFRNPSYDVGFVSLQNLRIDQGGSEIPINVPQVRQVSINIDNISFSILADAVISINIDNRNYYDIEITNITAGLFLQDQWLGNVTLNSTQNFPSRTNTTLNVPLQFVSIGLNVNRVVDIVNNVLDGVVTASVKGTFDAFVPAVGQGRTENFDKSFTQDVTKTSAFTNMKTFLQNIANKYNLR